MQDIESSIWAIFLLIIILFLVQCRPDLPPAESMKEYWNKAVERALKRKHGENFAPSSDDECTKACQKPPPPGFGQYLIHFREPKLENFKNLYNTEFLTKICGFANETTACVRACNDTQRRAYLRELFAPIKYLCMDSHIVENADCYRTAIEESGEECMTGQCADKKTMVHEKMETYREEGPGKEAAENFVGAVCELTKCGIFCGDSIRTEKCGPEANQELHNLVGEIAKSIEAIRYLSPRDYVIDVPAQCVAE